MSKPIISRLRDMARQSQFVVAISTGAATVAAAAVGVLGEAVLSPSQVAAAVDWQFYIDSSAGAQCDKCCIEGGLCCEVPADCDPWTAS